MKGEIIGGQCSSFTEGNQMSSADETFNLNVYKSR